MWRTFKMILDGIYANYVWRRPNIDCCSRISLQHTGNPVGFTKSLFELEYEKQVSFRAVVSVKSAAAGNILGSLSQARIKVECRNRKTKWSVFPFSKFYKRNHIHVLILGGQGSRLTERGQLPEGGWVVPDHDWGCWAALGLVCLCFRVPPCSLREPGKLSKAGKSYHYHSCHQHCVSPEWRRVQICRHRTRALQPHMEKYLATDHWKPLDSEEQTWKLYYNSLNIRYIIVQVF